MAKKGVIIGCSVGGGVGLILFIVIVAMLAKSKKGKSGGGASKGDLTPKQVAQIGKAMMKAAENVIENHHEIQQVHQDVLNQSYAAAYEQPTFQPNYDMSYNQQSYPQFEANFSL